MKKLILLNLLIILSSIVFAQNIMYVHLTGEQEEYIVSETDSIYFSENGNTLYLSIADNITEYLISEIDSITFSVSTDSSVYINYNGETTTVINPLSELGVLVYIDGSDVIVNSISEINDINFVLSGTTDNGMFKLYAEKRFNLLLNNINITNPVGPAINIQSGKTALVNLVVGTNNSLTDGIDYDDTPIDNGEKEDQKAAFFSEGNLIFIGAGSLTINGFGSDQHAMRSDDFIQIDEGSITVTSAVKDGIHGKDGFYMNGGSVNITSSGDGIDGSDGSVLIERGEITITSVEDDVKGIKTDNTITVNGGIINMMVEGNQSKGMKCDMNMMLNGGTINISTTGGVVLEPSGQGYDPSYCSAIKGEADIIIDGCTLNIITEGEAGKGLTSDGNIYIESGIINIVSSGDGAKYTNTDGEDDAYHGSCINVDGDVFFNNGSITVSNSGSGGKGISIDGDFIVSNNSDYIPLLDVTTTGEKITITPGGGGPGGGSGDYDEAKAVKVDGSITINSGEIIISSADDGIKSDESITFNNGNILITESIEGIEAPNIIINGGEISIYSTDDGFNATYGNGGEANDGSLLAINGGYIHVSASNGDALDSNGDITISGGTMVIHGPQSAPEVGMDVNGSCIISGGFMVVSGTNSNMTEGASSNSTQYSLLLRTNSKIPANTIFHIEDSSGNDIVTFSPYRNYYSIIFTSSELSNGETYNIYSGGTSSGSELNGLYTGGIYSGGTFQESFTINSMVTNVWF